MKNLFVFAIGGTGSRVVKALTFLLASGMKLNDVDAVVPIILDPDCANGDLTRTVDLLNHYRDIRKKTSNTEHQFFGTKVCSLYDLETPDREGQNGEFLFDIEGVKDHKFKEFISLNEMDKANRALASMLFSQENLDIQMEVGFKGNPNVGSVVLNKFSQTALFEKFASCFNKNDRIFIISSIFGGTGAAGFPLILKNIRSAGAQVPRSQFLRESKIGAITVLPYFSVERNERVTINSNTFISKTKAALHYYARNVSGNNSLQALYYVGDEAINGQLGSDGAAEQKNRAHFVELAGALAIQDFMNYDDEELEMKDGRVLKPKYLEFGLHDEAQKIRFNDLGKKTKELLANNLTQYLLFKNFWHYHYEEFQDDAWAKNGDHKLQTNQLDKAWAKRITEFNYQFEDWLNEMAISNVSFEPLSNALHGDDILNIVVNSPEKRKFLAANGLEFFRKMLNKFEPEHDKLKDSNQKLIALFAHATEEIIKARINL